MQYPSIRYNPQKYCTLQSCSTHSMVCASECSLRQTDSQPSFQVELTYLDICITEANTLTWLWLFTTTSLWLFVVVFCECDCVCVSHTITNNLTVQVTGRLPALERRTNVRKSNDVTATLMLSWGVLFHSGMASLWILWRASPNHSPLDIRKQTELRRQRVSCSATATNVTREWGGRPDFPQAASAQCQFSSSAGWSRCEWEENWNSSDPSCLGPTLKNASLRNCSTT